MTRIKYNPKKYIAQYMPNLRTPLNSLHSHIGICLFSAQFAQNKIVLDIGCGSGYVSNYLKRNARIVIGGDISSFAIGYAAAHYQKDGLYFLQLDAQNLPFVDSSFDLIVALEIIEHLPRYKQFLKECQRVLKENGTFVCSTPNKIITSPGSKKVSVPSHFKEFYPSELQGCLSSYFREVTLYGQNQVRGIGKIYFRLRAPFLPLLNRVSQIRKILWLLLGYLSLFNHPIKLSEIDEDNFAKIVKEEYLPFPTSLACSSFMIIIAVARK